MPVDIENFTVELQPEIDPLRSSVQMHLRITPLPTYRFELCRTQRSLPGLDLDECWIDRRRIYPSKGRSDAGFEELIDYFWACCLGAGSQLHQQTQEAYLLASLLPHVRREGSRMIVADAINSNRGSSESLDELTLFLESARGGEMDAVAFHDQTANMIGPEPLSDALVARYNTMKQELLEEPCSQMEAGGAAAGRTLVSKKWDHWMNTISRHGKKEARAVMNMLSYESRTAFAQCYSNLWVTLLPRLHQRFGWSDEAMRFHKFWHLEQRMPSNESLDNDFHLFHGLPFALHPACGRFMQCRPGKAIMATWLKEPSPTHTRRLLNGLYCAVSWYSGRRAADKQLRRDEKVFKHREELDMQASREPRPEEGIEDDWL